MSYAYNLERLERMSGMDGNTRATLEAYYDALPEKERLAILDEAGKAVRENLKNVPAPFAPEFSFSRFLIAIDRHRKDGQVAA
jgi:hypothetical protein